MIQCPNCGGVKSRVVATRSVGSSIRRSRACVAPGCGQRFFSVECSEAQPEAVSPDRWREVATPQQIEVVDMRAAGEKLSYIAAVAGINERSVSKILTKFAPHLKRRRPDKRLARDGE